MGQFDLSMTAGPIMVSGFIQGLGTGLLFAPLNVLAYAKLAPVHRTEGTIVSTMARSLGSSAGISLLQAMLIRDAAAAHSGLTTHITATDPVLRWALPQGFSLQSAPGLAALNGEITRQGSMISYDALFSGMAVACLLLAPSLLLLKPPQGPPPSGPEMAVD
jgi:DHA2 family multidrug resistance protein